MHLLACVSNVEDLRYMRFGSRKVLRHRGWMEKVHNFWRGGDRPLTDDVPACLAVLICAVASTARRCFGRWKFGLLVSAEQSVASIPDVAASVSPMT